jgi:hypothetical protein
MLNSQWFFEGEGEMKILKTIVGLLLMFFVSGCSFHMQPTTSLEEFAPKEEVEKKKNWVIDTHATNMGAAALGAVAGAIPVLIIPAALIISRPNEKNLTVSEIAELLVFDMYSYSSIIFPEDITCSDSSFGVDFFIEVKSSGEKDGIKPVLVSYYHNKGKKVYTEGWVMKKGSDGSLLYWKTSILTKRSDDTIYFFDENLKLKEALVGWHKSSPSFIFQKNNNSDKVSKNKREIIDDIKDYFLKNNPQMSKFKCTKRNDCIPGTSPKMALGEQQTKE